MPAPEEADALTLDLGSPVLDLRRTTRDRAGRAVVHVHIVVWPFAAHPLRLRVRFAYYQ